MALQLPLCVADTLGAHGIHVLAERAPPALSGRDEEVPGPCALAPRSHSLPTYSTPQMQANEKSRDLKTAHVSILFLTATQDVSRPGADAGAVERGEVPLVYRAMASDLPCLIDHRHWAHRLCK